MSIVYTVRADSPQAPPLARLIDLPLGLDIWQVGRSCRTACG
jgi:hypothetical protein